MKIVTLRTWIGGTYRLTERNLWLWYWVGVLLLSLVLIWHVAQRGLTPTFFPALITVSVFYVWKGLKYRRLVRESSEDSSLSGDPDV